MALIPDKVKPPESPLGPLGRKIFDDQKLKENIDQKRKQGRPTKEESEKRRIAGLEIGLEPKIKEIVADPDAQKHFIALCHAEGIQKVLAAMYKIGIMMTTAGILFVMKVPRKFFPDKSVPEDEARDWGLSLTEIMIELYGPEEALKKLRLVTLIGLPIMHVSERVMEAKTAHLIWKVENEIQTRVSPPKAES